MSSFIDKVLVKIFLFQKMNNYFSFIKDGISWLFLVSLIKEFF